MFCPLSPQDRRLIQTVGPDDLVVFRLCTKTYQGCKLHPIYTSPDSRGSRSIKFLSGAFTENNNSDTITNTDFACSLYRSIQTFISGVALHVQNNFSLRGLTMALELSSTEWIEADYSLETTSEVEKTAAIMAGEQSSGTFLSIPGETENLKQKFAAIVTSITKSGFKKTS